MEKFKSVENLSEEVGPAWALWQRHRPVILLYAALTLWVTLPLWLGPASRIQSMGDPLLNSYIIDWVHFALFHQIGDFFQATVFWPHADALAYGEHLLVPALLVLPFRILTSSAVALHNISLLQAYFFSALAAYALGLHLFQRRSVAAVAGAIYGFAFYRIQQMGHVQLVHGEFLPLTVLAFEKLLHVPTDERRKWQWLLGATAGAQWLTSWYWAIFSFWCLVPYFAGRFWQSRRSLSFARVRWIAAPLLIAAVCVLPIAWPYLQMKRSNFLLRPPEASYGLNARPTDYLAFPDRSWFAMHGEFIREPKPPSERALFPGFVVSFGLLAAVGSIAFRPRQAANDFPRRLWLGVVVLLLLFSFGSQWTEPTAQFSFSGETTARTIRLPYMLVEKFFPLANVMRVPARWMLPALLGISLLIADSLNRLINSTAESSNIFRKAPAMVKLYLILVVAELGMLRPVSEVMIQTHPEAVYEWLAQQPFPSPVFELPYWPEAGNLPMLHAIWHRQPTVNGTNGFMPPGHAQKMAVLNSFPSPQSVAALKKDGVRFVVIERPPADLAESLSGVLGPGYSFKIFRDHLVVRMP